MTSNVGRARNSFQMVLILGVHSMMVLKLVVVSSIFKMVRNILDRLCLTSSREKGSFILGMDVSTKDNGKIIK